MLPKFKSGVLIMSDNKQSQKAGDNSQLVQAGTVQIFNGIDEKRAREICAETYEIARRDFTADAYACANKRVQQFEESLFSRISKLEGALNSFADPAFQFLLTSAQKTAAASERDADYDMLAELLVCRIEKGQSRKTRTGISKAVEIVDKIDDDALCALTVIHTVKQILPSAGFCKAGIKILADTFEKLIYMELPTGIDWIEHLDILDAVRINNVNQFKKIDVLYPESLDGYSLAGIEIGSDNYKKALELLASVNLGSSTLVTNELLENYVRLPISNKIKIKDARIIYNTEVNGVVDSSPKPLNEKEIEILEAVWDLYTKDVNANTNAKRAFMKEWDNHPSLNKLHSWWDKIPYAIDITYVGTVLARTNARRCDKNIPELPITT